MDAAAEAAALKGHTVKSNARRAARKAGVDPDGVALSADGLWYVGETPEQQAARLAAASAEPETTEPETKPAIMLRLLGRPDGASIAEMAAATGWLPHTTRARLSGLNKTGPRTTSEEIEGRGKVHRLAKQGSEP